MKKSIFRHLFLMAFCMPIVAAAQINSEEINPPDPLLERSLVIFSNLTWGLPNTLLGGIVTGATAAVYPKSAYLNVSRNGYQVCSSGELSNRIGEGPFGQPFQMSLGLFEIGNCDNLHEAGHSKQSAILGPFYLPYVATSYLLNGRHRHAQVEEWADQLAPKGLTKNAK